MAFEKGDVVKSLIDFTSKSTGKRITIGLRGVVQGPSTKPDPKLERVSVLFDNGVLMNLKKYSQINHNVETAKSENETAPKKEHLADAASVATYAVRWKRKTELHRQGRLGRSCCRMLHN